MTTPKLEDAPEFLGNLDQLCYARCSVLADGAGKGQRLIDVFNGSGLAFTVTPDRAMNLVECSFKGIPLVFRTPGGHRLPTGDFLRDWAGGLLTTCGLRNAGNPSADEGLHGKISQMGAEMLSVQRDARGAITISGTMREAVLFGTNLRLNRTIRCAYNDNRIILDDEVVNCAPRPEYIEILYHCNFGWPLVSPDLRFVVPEHPVEPRDEWAAQGLEDWNKLCAPVPNFREQCFRHKLPAEDNGLAAMVVENPKLGIGVRVAYDTATLPQLVQWKNCGANEYVLGLEPTCASLNGREADIAAGIMPQLQPGESRKFHVELSFYSL
ncbi:MAG: aldose 1-epimerase family protein [Lentisphaeria bacterium]|nr:aldose 1-epimerase family protein [Lentisphaeria bacterium]